MDKSKFFNEHLPIVYIHAGLGNQLFQIAAANAIIKESEYLIDLGDFNPSSQPIFKFTIRNKLKFLPSRKKSFFEQKLINLIIRANYRPNKKSKTQLVFSFVDFISKFILSKIYLAGREVITSTSLGFDPQFTVGNPYSYIIGYFQTYVWPSNSANTDFFKDLNLVKKTPEFELMCELSRSEIPLIVHIRLGDYFNQNSFGLLSKDYFHKAIESQWKTKKYKKLWIFSNEPDLVESYIPPHLIGISRCINLDLNDAATTLQLFRFGYGYVLSNSTFGWWGAFLTLNEGVDVVVPKPWFRFAKDPNHIIPSNWLRMNGWSAENQ